MLQKSTREHIKEKKTNKQTTMTTHTCNLSKDQQATHARLLTRLTVITRKVC